MSRHVTREATGSTAPGESGSAPNRLSREKSPYLLQHAWNPVDWHPWGDEAFDRARRENKPIFLSIGYATCHWCHVMERESFEDDEVADVLNRGFVAVKVDREERPDIDRLYMTAMQALGLGGGWPLTVFMTPELEPFFGGTYFPPRTIAGRIGMLDLLPRVLSAWNERGDEVRETGASVLAALQGVSHVVETKSPGRTTLLVQAHDMLARAFDREWGGFGPAPKFPQVVNLEFLLRWHARDPENHARALDMALRQLDAMRRGGIHDHLGGGFHRYSTDREWLVPHFEKMLYDQGQLAAVYLDAHRITKRPEYAEVARGILDYVTRDLTSPEGAFDSAEDADSEGEEGRFYVWTAEQIADALPPDLAELVVSHDGVTPGGNFEHGTSILHEARSIEETASRHGLRPDEAAARLGEAHARLLEARSKRVRPLRDDKVIAAWNGLMITAFARGAIVLDDPALLERARRAAEFVWDRMRDASSGALRRIYRDGEAAVQAQLDDHAHLALGFVEMYRASLEPLWLERAVAIVETLVDRFWNTADGGFFSSPADTPHLRLRLEDDHDGAEVSGSSTAMECLVTLAALLDRAEWRELTRRAFARYERTLARYPLAMPRMLGAMLLDGPTRHVVIAGPRDRSDTRALLRVFNERYRPGDFALLTAGAETAGLERLAPFAASLEPREGRATAYVCIDYACRLPITDPAEFAVQLDAVARSSSGEPR